MLVNHAALQQIFTGFKQNFQSGFEGVTPTWSIFSTEVPSSTEAEFYAWLEDFPMMREWLGARQVKDIKAESYSLINRLFEATVSVKRTKIEDDTFGTYAPIFSEMGASAQRQKDELMYAVVAAGDASNGFDGVPFFGTTHPHRSGAAAQMTNINTSGGGSKWVLADLSRPLKPFIYQNRLEAELTAKLNPDTSDDVFDNDRFKFGSRARNVGGYGFWQMAYQSNEAITETTVDAAIAAMMTLESDNGAKLGINPTHIIAAVDRRAEVLDLFGRAVNAAGASNRSFGVLTPLITPYL